MMKIFYLILLAAAMHGAPAFAETSLPSPLIGSWAVDTARLTMPAEARPKSVTITYDDVGDGKTMTETVVYFTSEGAPAMRTNHFNRVR